MTWLAIFRGATPSPRLTAAPNPFNPATALRFALPAADRVRLTVHDATGRCIRRLLDTSLAAGDLIQ